MGSEDQSRPESVQDYVDGLDGAARQCLQELRVVSVDSAPQAEETLKWGHPAYLHRSGTILFVVSAHARHANMVFTPSTRQAFDAELVEFVTGKGSVQLRYGSKVPAELLRRMIAHRIREHEEDGILWK